jgi:hypothetical protein
MTLPYYDVFGVGAAVRSFLRTYENANRKTGRTTRTVEQVQPGDVVICGGNKTRILYACELKQRGLEVTGALDQHTSKNVLLLVDRKGSGRDMLMAHPRTRGFVHMTHDYVEQVYEDAVALASERLARIRDKWGGEGERRNEPSINIIDREGIYH